MSALVPLTASDIAAIMRIERGEGYDRLVGRWEAGEHAAEMARATSRYLGLKSPNEILLGFVIFQDLDRPTALLRRIAVDSPGSGAGGRLLRAAIAWVFAHGSYDGVRLEVRDINDRARRVYEREGFRLTGVSEDDHLEMALAGSDWNSKI